MTDINHLFIFGKIQFLYAIIFALAFVFNLYLLLRLMQERWKKPMNTLLVAHSLLNLIGTSLQFLFLVLTELKPFK